MKAVTYRDSVPGIVTSPSAGKGWEKLDLTKLFEGEFRMYPTGFYSSEIAADSAGLNEIDRTEEQYDALPPKQKAALREEIMDEVGERMIADTAK